MSPRYPGFAGNVWDLTQIDLSFAIVRTTLFGIAPRATDSFPVAIYDRDAVNQDRRILLARRLLAFLRACDAREP